MPSEIFENYEAFYTMLVSTTMLSNTITKDVAADSEKVIDFVGKAFGLNARLIEQCKDIVLRKLSFVALISDAKAMYNSVQPQDKHDEETVLCEIKSNVLEEIFNLGGNNHDRLRHFDYTHYNAYEPHVRFFKICQASSTGNIVATRQVGIMKMLGIGCEKNVYEAISRLLQCSIWADVPSMYLLAHCYAAIGNDEKSQIFLQLAKLCEKYLLAGITVLPQEARNAVSEDAAIYYAYVSTILQDVILAYKVFDIDYSFVEAITSDSLDYFQRMNFINNYDKKEWKNVTNSAIRPSKRIGF